MTNIENARAFVESLRAENQQLDQKIEAAQENIAAWTTRRIRNTRVVEPLVAWLHLEGVAIDGDFDSSPPEPEIADPQEPSFTRSHVNGSPHRKSTRAEIFTEVLRERGPIEIADMRAPVRAKGYGVRMKDNVLYNSIYTSLAKREDLFEREGKLWRLKDLTSHDSGGSLFEHDD